MRVLIGCEFSGVVRSAFRDRGHDAWSCDILPTDDGSQYHYQCDVLELLYDSNAPHWDLAIFHPPCTYLTNAGVRHLKDDVSSCNGVKAKVHGEERFQLMLEACTFFNYLKSAPVPKICIENPIPHGYARERIGKYTQTIQPWMFGHLETKATCLWLKGLPPLVNTTWLKRETSRLPDKEKHKNYYTSPGPDRWKLRSVTYAGIARAMASQWG